MQHLFMKNTPRIIISKKYIFCFALSIPSFIGFFIFWVLPFIENFIYMVADGSFAENVQYLCTNKYFLLAIKNTVIFTGIAALSAVCISFIMAILTLKAASNISFIRNALFLSVILPSAVIVIIWQLLFWDTAPFNTLFLVYLWKYSGLYYVLILTALASIDQNILDAAVIDGANYKNLVVHIMIPSIVPTLFFTYILSISDSLKIFRESYLLYGAYPDKEVYMLQNFINNHFDKLNYNYISTVSILLLLIVYIIIAVFGVIEKKWSDQIW